MILYNFHCYQYHLWCVWLKSLCFTLNHSAFIPILWLIKHYTIRHEWRIVLFKYYASTLINRSIDHLMYLWFTVHQYDHVLYFYWRSRDWQAHTKYSINVPIRFLDVLTYFWVRRFETNQISVVLQRNPQRQCIREILFDQIDRKSLDQL